MANGIGQHTCLIEPTRPLRSSMHWDIRNTVQAVVRKLSPEAFHRQTSHSFPDRGFPLKLERTQQDSPTSVVRPQSKESIHSAQLSATGDTKVKFRVRKLFAASLAAGRTPRGKLGQTRGAKGTQTWCWRTAKDASRRIQGSCNRLERISYERLPTRAARQFGVADWCIPTRCHRR